MLLVYFYFLFFLVFLFNFFRFLFLFLCLLICLIYFILVFFILFSLIIFHFLFNYFLLFDRLLYYLLGVTRNKQGRQYLEVKLMKKHTKPIIGTITSCIKIGRLYEITSLKYTLFYDVFFLSNSYDDSLTFIRNFYVIIHNFPL